MALNRYSGAFDDLSSERAARRYLQREFGRGTDGLLANLRGVLGVTQANKLQKGLAARTVGDRRWSDALATAFERRDHVVTAARRLRTALHRFEALDAEFDVVVFGWTAARGEPSWRRLMSEVDAFVGSVPKKNRSVKGNDNYALVAFAVSARLNGARLTGKRLAALEAIARGAFHSSVSSAARKAKHWEGWLSRHRATIENLVAQHSLQTRQG